MDQENIKTECTCGSKGILIDERVIRMGVRCMKCGHQNKAVTQVLTLLKGTHLESRALEVAALINHNEV